MNNTPQYEKHSVGHKLCRQWVLKRKILATSLQWLECHPSTAGHTGGHLGRGTKEDQRHLDSRVEECFDPIRFEENWGDTLNPFRFQIFLVNVSGTPDSICRTFLFSVASYLTWEDPSLSQKKHLWCIFKNWIFFFFNRRGLRKRKNLSLLGNGEK